jgi:hypothetical protein
MGRGSLWACAWLGAIVVFSVVSLGGLAGCQPLYGGKPEKLPTVVKKKPPPDADTDVKIKDIEDCQADFHADPKSVRQQSNVATQLTSEGDTAIANSDKAGSAAGQAGLLRDGIDKYRNALLKDPYHVEATLRLALAYDKVYRKGCALAMLKRLASLSANPKFARAATPAIDSIGDNAQWFKRYRKDAMSAVGR